jgi:hypothetical protein
MYRMLQRITRYVVGPPIRVALRRIRIDDPWATLGPLWRLELLAGGARRPFRWYLEGKSNVRVATVDDICAWLSECTYVTDRALFNEADFWQHPLTFEQIRKGDCEDHALWGWRKLLELGVDARIVVGTWKAEPNVEWGMHAWVEYTGSDGERHLMEAIRGDRRGMVAPISAVRGGYMPHYSVDRSLRPMVHGGAVLEVQRRES